MTSTNLRVPLLLISSVVRGEDIPHDLKERYLAHQLAAERAQAAVEKELTAQQRELVQRMLAASQVRDADVAQMVKACGEGKEPKLDPEGIPYCADKPKEAK